MKIHTCKVRLQGEVKDEVQKIGVTSAEIRVLKHIHGEDSVVEVRASGNVDRDEAQERVRLGDVYGEKIVTEMFGAPVATIADEIETDDIEEAPEAGPLAVVKRTNKIEPKGLAALTE